MFFFPKYYSFFLFYQLRKNTEKKEMQAFQNLKKAFFPNKNFVEFFFT